MKTWIKLLVVAALLGPAVTDEVKGQVCDIDEAGLSKQRSLDMAVNKVGPCFQGVFTAEIKRKLKDTVRKGNTLEEFRDVVKDICLEVPQFVSCLAGVRESLQHCQNKEAFQTIQFFSKQLEHILPIACENDGHRLGYVAHITALVTESRYSSLSECTIKLFNTFEVIVEAKIDIVSKSYIFYKEVFKCKKCLAHLVDEDHKTVMEWLINEVLTSMKCQHPEEDMLVPCGDIDVSKVKVTTYCDLEPFNNKNLYELLEERVIRCNSHYVDQSFYEQMHINDLQQLKDYFKNKCNARKELPNCILKRYAFAEGCLSQEEEKQFQLFAQSMEDIVERSCVEEGVWMATVMHEVYQKTSEHGHAFSDCFDAAKEARKSHQGHAVSSKNMRFYHEMIAFKQCVVDKLQYNNDLSKGVENMINDVLKKMKCVSPEDGTVVLCETIHEQ